VETQWRWSWKFCDSSVEYSFPFTLAQKCKKIDQEIRELRPKTSMSVLLIVGPKCTLVASHAAPWWVTVSMSMGQTDGRTPDRYITRNKMTRFIWRTVYKCSEVSSTEKVGVLCYQCKCEGGGGRDPRLCIEQYYCSCRPSVWTVGQPGGKPKFWGHGPHIRHRNAIV